MANKKGIKKKIDDPLEVKTIGEDLDLCTKNAKKVGHYMKEDVTIHSLGKGKAKRYFFRLASDPREVSEYSKIEAIKKHRTGAMPTLC
jgi:hypothetical protein